MVEMDWVDRVRLANGSSLALLEGNKQEFRTFSLPCSIKQLVVGIEL